MDKAARPQMGPLRFYRDSFIGIVCCKNLLDKLMDN